MIADTNENLANNGTDNENDVKISAMGNYSALIHSDTLNRYCILAARLTGPTGHSAGFLVMNSESSLQFKT